MSIDYQVSGNEGPVYPVPPSLPRLILSFFLPIKLQDPVLGDLEEEYVARSLTKNSWFQTNGWYWLQALSSACVFFWQQRGTEMAYFISVLFFLAMMILAMATAQFGFWLVSPPILIALIPLALAMGIGATSMQACKLGFKASFSDA